MQADIHTFNRLMVCNRGYFSRYTRLVKVGNEKGSRMTNDKIRRNDQIRMTKPAIAQLGAFEHSGFGFLWSLVIVHCSFNDLCKSGSWPQCALSRARPALAGRHPTLTRCARPAGAAGGADASA